MQNYYSLIPHSQLYMTTNDQSLKQNRQRANPLYYQVPKLKVIVRHFSLSIIGFIPGRDDRISYPSTVSFLFKSKFFRPSAAQRIFCRVLGQEENIFFFTRLSIWRLRMSHFFSAVDCLSCSRCSSIWVSKMDGQQLHWEVVSGTSVNTLKYYSVTLSNGLLLTSKKANSCHK